MRLLFCGTPGHSAKCLESLHGYCQSSFLCEIIGVCSTPFASVFNNASSVSVCAKSLGIPLFTPENPGEKSFIAKLADLQPDVCITVSYGKYLSSSFLKIPVCGTINIHPSLLPLYRGASPVPTTILNGDSESGFTILYTEKKMDAGPIIHQEKVRLTSEEYAQDLIESLLIAGMRYLCNDDVMSSILNRTCKSQHQIEVQGIQTAPKLSQPSPIDPGSITSTHLHRLIRAYDGYFDIVVELRLCSLDLNDCAIEVIPLKIVRASIKKNDNTAIVNNKRLVQWRSGQLLLSCSDVDWLVLEQVAILGQKTTSAKEFYNGLAGKRKMKNIRIECHKLSA